MSSVWQVSYLEGRIGSFAEAIETVTGLAPSQPVYAASQVGSGTCP